MSNEIETGPLIPFNLHTSTLFCDASDIAPIIDDPINATGAL